MKCLRGRVVLKRNFHLKGSEGIRTEFAVFAGTANLQKYFSLDKSNFCR